MSKAPLTPSPQQLIEKQQRNIENVMTAQNHLFASLEKLVNLNIELFKSSLDEVAAQSQKVGQLQVH
ncbi:Phasin protein [Oligella ureolytica]|uniref:Phasin family protein n=1 Tax=Oligella ureolytica TaxID=90244 RepID=A0A378XH69_9BURK|nr:phasin family protein [Oligella ureolytica]QPT39717.1 phasin family protein [Oligella ureolytica]SUA52332.1 Phasin protein [Oligella ureolytica]SUA57297.1 Phasin protein [Oligella ureolytica]